MNTPALTADQQTALDAIAEALHQGTASITPDALAARLAWPIDRVRTALAELERLGLVAKGRRP